MPPDPDLDSDATIRGLHAAQRVFERYTLVRIVGRGGMGIVWLARDDKLAREVALKFLPEFFVHDQFAVEQLKRETSRCLALTHDGIVRTYDFLEDPDRSLAAISMEYVAGANLSNLRLQRPHHCFSIDELGPIARQVCEALNYAHHRAHVVHRDIKPANLLLDSRGEVKITDFGIARSMADSASRISADLNMSGGTLTYMSPQQALGERPAVADDIYSLGATLYELLTGRPPFYSGNIYAQLRDVIPPSLAARRAEFGVPEPSVPRAWEETIHACLEKSPEHRPQSALEVAERMGLLGRPVAITTAPQPPVVPTPQPPPRFPVRVFAAVATAVACLLLIWLLLVVRPERVATKETLEERERELIQAAETNASLQRDLDAAKTAAGTVATSGTPQLNTPGILLVPAQYKTIQEAIMAARPGETVIVTPGTYREALQFKDGVKVIGTDPQTCLLKVPSGPPAAIMAIDCKSGSIERLDISPADEKPQVYWPDFALDADDRIAIIGAGGNAAKGGLKPGTLIRSINGFKLAPGLAPYLLVRENLTLEFEEQGGKAGILSLNNHLRQIVGLPSGVALIRSPIEVRNCEVHGFLGSGIHVLGATPAKATVHANRCLKNDVGILISDGATAELRYNIAATNKKNGIEFYEANGEAEANACLLNGATGIQVSGAQTNPELLRNVCGSNTQHGILANAGTLAAIDMNVCNGNKGVGILIADRESKPNVAGSKLLNNAKGDLVVEGGAEPQIAEEDRRYLVLAKKPETPRPAPKNPYQ